MNQAQRRSVELLGFYKLLVVPVKHVLTYPNIGAGTLLYC